MSSLTAVVLAILEVVLVGLAGYRATRLAVRDDFPPIARPRQAVQRWADRHRQAWLYDLADCHWCASGWITLGLVAGVDLLSHIAVPLPPLVWGGSWAVAALLGQAEPDK
jgi:hypothetical protein